MRGRGSGGLCGVYTRTVGGTAKFSPMPSAASEIATWSGDVSETHTKSQLSGIMPAILKFLFGGTRESATVGMSNK